MGISKGIRPVISICIMAALLMALIFWQSNKSFDIGTLKVDNIYKHIEELTSEAYTGRLAGSDGDRRALNYIENHFKEVGLRPAGVEDTFFQPFSTIIPDYDTNPTFTILSADGTIIKEFLMFKDYNIITSMNGGGIDFLGQLIFVGSDLLRIEPEFIKDRIVVIEASFLTQRQVNYVKENGGKGIFCSADNKSYMKKKEYELQKSLSIAGKTGEAILVGYISGDTYKYMSNLMVYQEEENQSFGILSDVNIKVNIGYPIVETANILGKIEGKSSKGKVLLITTNIDGTGAARTGEYFSGAISNTSGIALLMEVARVIADQKNLPYQTIIFVGWNGQQQQLSGSDYYINNPLYPLEKTSVIHLQAIGEKTLDGLKISSDMINSTILRDKIMNFALDEDLLISESMSGYSVINQFNDKSVASVLLLDSTDRKNTYGDTIENIDVSYLENASLILLNYIKRDVYKDVRLDYLNLLERLLLAIVAFMGIISYLIVRWYNSNPTMKILGWSIENIYFFTPIMLIRRFFTTILPYFLAVFMLVLLINIDPGTNIKVINGDITSNISLYLIIKKSILYLRSMLDLSLHKTQTVGNIFEVIYNSSKNSILLISASLTVSTIVGILRGMYEGYKAKKIKLDTMGSLVVFSVPEVLIVLLGLMACTFIARNFPGLNEILSPKAFIMPLLTLSIIPTIYISRITYITIQEELGKDYIKNARAKGFSRRKILFNELIYPIVFKIVDTMPTIMTMLLSNMIVVEYLFNYHGIVYFLLYLYKRRDIYRFVPLAMTLGLIYIIFTWGIQLLAKIINPLKREVRK